MMRNCWIVTYKDYHGEYSQCVFYKKEDAEKCIKEDFENALHDLKKMGGMTRTRLMERIGRQYLFRIPILIMNGILRFQPLDDE